MPASKTAGWITFVGQTDEVGVALDPPEPGKEEEPSHEGNAARPKECSATRVEFALFVRPATPADRSLGTGVGALEPELAAGAIGGDTPVADSVHRACGSAGLARRAGSFVHHPAVDGTPSHQPEQSAEGAKVAAPEATLDP